MMLHREPRTAFLNKQVKSGVMRYAIIIDNTWKSPPDPQVWLVPQIGEAPRRVGAWLARDQPHLALIAETR
jgi:hypothetical protein